MNNATKAPKTPKAHSDADSVLEEVWRIKDKLSAAYNHDVHRLFAEARKREKVSGHRIVNLQVRRKKPANGK